MASLPGLTLSLLCCAPRPVPCDPWALLRVSASPGLGDFQRPFPNLGHFLTIISIRQRRIQQRRESENSTVGAGRGGQKWGRQRPLVHSGSCACAPVCGAGHSGRSVSVQVSTRSNGAEGGELSSGAGDVRTRNQRLEDTGGDFSHSQGGDLLSTRASQQCTGSPARRRGAPAGRNRDPPL